MLLILYILWYCTFPSRSVVINRLDGPDEFTVPHSILCHKNGMEAYKINLQFYLHIMYAREMSSGVLVATQKLTKFDLLKIKQR